MKISSKLSRLSTLRIQLTCSKISASKLMNLICSLELHLMFKYGSNEMVCSTNNCGLICAKE